MNIGRLCARDRPASVQMLAVLVLTVAAGGCSRSNRDAGRIVVSGTVAYDGKLLEQGSVLFAAAGGRDTASAPIRKGGSFRVSLLPGEYEAAVRCFADEGATKDPHGMTPPKSLVPEKYVDATTSGLKVKASPGMPPIRLDLSR